MENNCLQRVNWTGKNKLGQMLTELREEIKLIPKTHMDVGAQINQIGMSIEPEVDLGALQRACPEIGNYFRYIENRIRPSDENGQGVYKMTIRIIILSNTYYGI